MTQPATVSVFNSWLSYVIYPHLQMGVVERNGMLYLQAHWEEPCSVTGKPSPQASRQWLLHPNMTKSEVIQTAFKCCLTAAEHEVREQFKYRGKAIFGPHFDVDRLADLITTQGASALDYRKDPK